MTRGRANPSIRTQGVFRRFKWNRSDAYCGKKISLVYPMRLAKKQNNTVDKSAVVDSIIVSFHALWLSTASSNSGHWSPCSSNEASVVVESNGSILSWELNCADVLVQLFLGSWTMHIQSPITRYNARARAKGSHILRANVQASIGGAVGSLIESMRPKK